MVVSVTLKTFPEPPVIIQNFNATFPDNATLYSFVESYLETLTAIADAGGSGYYFIDPLGVILQNGLPAFLVAQFFFNKTDTAATNALFEPLYETIYRVGGKSLGNLTSFLPLARYAYPQRGGYDPSGLNVILGSRLYSRNLLESPDGPVRLSNAIKNITSTFPTIVQGHLTAGGQVARNSHIDSALNPSWRKALGQIIISSSWPDDASYSTQIEIQQAMTNILVPILAAVEPDMGAYTNEADLNEPQWQKVFWGTNYPKLLEVKRKWDPHGLLRCNRCVGSERWDATGNCPA